MDKKEQARRMYEDDGVALVEIARQLGVKDNTVRTWKHRGKWKPKDLSQTRGHNPNSLANLDMKYPNFEAGNQVAVKHGLYSNYLKAECREIYESIQDVDPVNLLEEVIRISFANYISRQKYLDLSDPISVSCDTNQARTINILVKDYVKIKETRTDDGEDDEFIVAIKYAADRVWNSEKVK